MGPTRTPHDYPGIPTLRDVVEAVRYNVGTVTNGSTFPRPFTSRPFSGDEPERDIRTTVLSLLNEKPQHGAQIIRTITERSDGGWEPSAAEVYPTLQLLVDEALATVEEQDGRRQYSLTDAGREEAATLAAARENDGGDDGDEDGDDTDSADADTACASWTPWGRIPRFSGTADIADFAESRSELPRAGAKLGQAVHQVGLTGTEEQRARVAALLDDTRRGIYSILAEEPAEAPAEADATAETTAENAADTDTAE